MQLNSSIDITKLNDMQINFRGNFYKIYKNADFFFVHVGNYSTICKKYGTLSTTSLYNMTFESTKFPVLSSDRGHTHDDMSSLSTTNNTTDEVATTGTAESIFSSMTRRELTASDLIEICKIIYFTLYIMFLFRYLKPKGLNV